MILSYFFLSSRNILCCYNLKKIHLDNHMIICFCSRLWLIRSSLYACIDVYIVSFFCLQFENNYGNAYAAIWAYSMLCHFRKITQVEVFFFSFPMLFPCSAFTTSGHKFQL